MEKKPVKIIIVDDNPGDQVLLKPLLQAKRESDCEFLIASDFENGLELAASHGADCILIDYFLPNMDGLDFLDELSKCAEEGITPVIFLTGRDDGEIALDAMTGGDRDSAAKDRVTRESLSKAVTRVVKKKRADRSVREQSIFTRTLLDAIPNPVYYENGGLLIEECNRSFEDFTGLPRKEVIGKTIDSFIFDDDLEKYRETVTFLMKNPGNYVFESVFPGKNGEMRNVIYNKSTFVDVRNDVRGIVTVMTDITDRKKAEEKIRKLALYDSLTGLPNRTLLFDRMALSMFRSERYKDILGVLDVDLDGFKEVNDQNGHDGGDQVLKETAKRLNSCIRRSDTICRYGGDEFVILLSSPKSKDDIMTVCKKIIDVMSESFSVGDNTCSLGASIGVSIYPENSRQSDELIRLADEAMYRVKRECKKSFVFYS